MGFTIQNATHGYSQSGAAEYVSNIHQNAIVETKRLLGNVDSIRTALANGWQGQAQLNFMSNFQGAVKEVQNTLDELDGALTKEFESIEDTWVEEDTNLVPKRYEN